MALVELAACGDLEGVKELLADAGTSADNVNSMDKDGRSAFHYSALNDDTPLMTALLADARTNVALCTPKGDTALHLASLYASQRAMRMLLGDARGTALLNAQNNFGETSLHLCAGSGDKGATKAARILLDAGASMALADQWGRGPADVAKDNGEGPCVALHEKWMTEEATTAQKEAVARLTDAYKASATATPAIADGERSKTAKLVFAGLGGALSGLKKVSVTEKSMFSKTAGKVTTKTAGAGNDARSRGKVLSKLVDFPGDQDEIAKHLADSEVDAGGADAYGLTALHKFASWNKTELMDMLLPKLTPAQVNAQDPEGKTALHWACEMASVAAVRRLVACADVDDAVKDAKGRTPLDIVDSGTGAVVERVRMALTGK